MAYNGLSKQEIINKMGHMSMIGIAYQNNHDLDQPEIVEKMFSDLKVKIEGTSRSTVCTISRNEKEIISDENIDSNTVSFVFAKKIFDDDLLEIKRFVGNSKPMSFTKNWYSKPTPLDM